MPFILYPLRLMESFLKSLSNVLIALIVVGVAIAIVYFLSPGSLLSPDKNQLNQQLAQIDLLFNASKVPAQNIDILIPQHVGKFERTSNIEITTPECAKSPKFPIRCFSTTYQKLDEGDKSPLEFNIWANGSRLETVDNRAFSFSCGDVVIGTELRNVGDLKYRYHIACSSTLFRTQSLGGIIWQNGSWFLGVKGDYDSIRQFIAAYPY
ncbi:MAG: hypothetical protein ABI690_08325 [Chloroflexota bacterium]